MESCWTFASMQANPVMILAIGSFSELYSKVLDWIFFTGFWLFLIISFLYVVTTLLYSDKPSGKKKDIHEDNAQDD